MKLVMSTVFLVSLLISAPVSAQMVTPPSSLVDVKELAERVKKGDVSEDARIEAIKRLAYRKYKNDIDVLEALMIASDRGSLKVRWAAVEAIGEVLADAEKVWLGVVGAVARWLDASREESPELRSVAAQALRKIQCTDGYVLYHLEKALDPELENVDYVREEAIMTLVSFKTPEALSTLKRALERNETVHRYRIQAIQAGISELENKIKDKIPPGDGGSLF